MKLKNIKKISKNFLQKIRKGLGEKSTKKFLIYGEVIVDQYIDVRVLGKSQKNNIISTKYQNSNSYGGGTILVANFLSEFSNNVEFILPYNDHAYRKIRYYFDKKIKIIKLYNKYFKPIFKIRYRDSYKNLNLFQMNLNEDLNLNLDQNLINIFKKYKLHHKIIYDFGYNFINKKILAKINRYGNFNINCQTNSSNYGYNLITKYFKGQSLCVDEEELRLSFSDKKTEMKTLIKKNINFLKKFKYFVVTVGKKGCYFVSKGKIEFCPSIKNLVGDTTGCGDIFFAAFNFFSSLKTLNLYEIIFCSHVCAYIHGTKPGNKNIINKNLFYKFVENILK